MMNLEKRRFEQLSLKIFVGMDKISYFAVINQQITMNNQQQQAKNRIKAVLADEKKTCRWLAEQLGKSENTVSRWCANRVQPSIQQLVEIANILHIDVRELIKSNKSI